MSFSRTQYDTDAYKYALEESTQPGKAQLQKFAFTRADHCFAETPEQRVQTRRVFKNYEQNDLVNIESDLQGVTRKWSKDPKQHNQHGVIKVAKRHVYIPKSHTNRLISFN